MQVYLRSFDFILILALSFFQAFSSLQISV